MGKPETLSISKPYKYIPAHPPPLALLVDCLTSKGSQLFSRAHQLRCHGLVAAVCEELLIIHLQAQLLGALQGDPKGPWGGAGGERHPHAWGNFGPLLDQLSLQIKAVSSHCFYMHIEKKTKRRKKEDPGHVHDCMMITMSRSLVLSGADRLGHRTQSVLEGFDSASETTRGLASVWLPGTHIVCPLDWGFCRLLAYT